MHTLLGLTKQEYEANVEDYNALVGASPSRLLGLELAVTNTNAGTASSIRAIGRLTFDVVYFQPTPVAQS